MLGLVSSRGRPRRIMPDHISLTSAPLLVMLGVTCYLTVRHLWLLRGGQRAAYHPWIAGWCAVASLFLAGRFLQRVAEDVQVAALGARLQYAAAVALALLSIMVLRSVAGLVTSRQVVRWTVGVASVLAVVALATDGFVTSQSFVRTNLLGDHYHALTPGRLLPLAITIVAVVLLYCGQLVLRTKTEFPFPKRQLWITVGLFALFAANDFAMQYGVIRSLHLLEYAFFAPAVVFTFVAIRGVDQEHATLEAAVTKRTAQLHAHQERLEQALDELKVSEARWRQLSDATFEGVLVHEDGRVVDANEAAGRLLGVPVQQVVGAEVRSLLGEGGREDLDALLDGTQEQLHTSARRADGGGFPVELVGRRIQIDGRSMGVLALRDRTEHNLLQARLMESDRLASVGTLAAGVAHEINNPLTYVLANLQLLAKRSDAPGAEADHPRRGPSTELLADAIDGAKRIRQVARDLRTLAREADEERRPVAVKDALEVALRMADNEIRHRAQLVRELEEVPSVLGSEGRLVQLFLNLLVNAAQAIEVGRAAQNEIRVRLHSSAAGAVVVEVQDTGEGIAADGIGRVFEPFVSTKKERGGMGLGLSICRTIVTAMGGDIAVHSTLGEGTTFVVTLPAADQTTVGRRALGRRSGIRARQARVLVVDDDRTVAGSLQRALADYQTEVACSGTEALARCAEEAFDVVICDVMMPDSTGMDVYEELKRAQPQLVPQVIFMTGGSFTPKAKRFVADQGGRCLDKPVDLADLQMMIERLLAESAA